MPKKADRATVIVIMALAIIIMVGVALVAWGLVQ